MESDHFYLSGLFSENDNEIKLSVESYICAFVYQYCDLRCKVHFIAFGESYPYTINSSAFHIIEKNDKEDFQFMLPAIVTEESRTTIAGLCAALRWAIKTQIKLYPEHYSADLLGFRGGCLVACAESSIWTKFCEILLPGTVQEVFSKSQNECYLKEIPSALVLLEAHLKGPVRTHNILKRKLDIAKKIKEDSSSTFIINNDKDFVLYDKNAKPVDVSDIHERLQNLVVTEKSKDFDLNHSYLEGIDLTLADMIAFPCIYYLLKKLPPNALKYLTNVTSWFKRMWSHPIIESCAKSCGMTLKEINEKYVSEDSININVPEVEQMSLYKRDPSHTKVKCKYKSPDKILSLLFAAGIKPKYESSYCTSLEWDILPNMLHPATGDLPPKRLERKCQQIESIVTAVLKIAKEEQTIVEFCSGGGHVGLLLAHFLPKCKILLIENKESSMMRAKSRAENLKLSNVYFYQCNLDYFKGPFDIGVSLHACGVATDLVIQQCLEKQASFVCCPCCYGSIQDTHLLSYPLSKKFRNTNISLDEYTLLAHFADRTEVNTPTAEQGKICMGLIDTDRLCFAEEQGYQVDLTTLHPVTCSPKHNLLIGRSLVEKRNR